MKTDVPTSYVLIVGEKDKDHKDLVQLVESAGFKALLAGNFQKAVDFFNGDKEIAVVITGTNVLDHAATSFVQYMRHKQKNVPLIILAEQGSLESCQEAMRLGAADYIHKLVADKEQFVLSLLRAVTTYWAERKNQALQAEILLMLKEHTSLMEDVMRKAEMLDDLYGRIDQLLAPWEK